MHKVGKLFTNLILLCLVNFSLAVPRLVERSNKCAKAGQQCDVSSRDGKCCDEQNFECKSTGAKNGKRICVAKPPPCGTQCTSNAQCLLLGSGYTCSDGCCKPLGCALKCEGDTVCKTLGASYTCDTATKCCKQGQSPVCDTGVKVCVIDLDCLTEGIGYSCSGSCCQPPDCGVNTRCRTNSQCTQPGFTCSLTSGCCTPPLCSGSTQCSSNGDCTRPGYTCGETSGCCEPPTCTGSSRCESNTECTEPGFTCGATSGCCVPPNCETSRQCTDSAQCLLTGSGYTCAGGCCQGIGCTLQTTCGFGFDCSLVGVNYGCDPETGCCVPPSPPECGTDPVCTEDADCDTSGLGLTCQSGCCRMPMCMNPCTLTGQECNSIEEPSICDPVSLCCVADISW